MKYTRKEEGKDSHRNTTFRRISFLLSSHATRRPFFGVRCASCWLSLQLPFARFFPFSDFLVSSNLAIVRCIPTGAPDLIWTLKSPFIIEGAWNVLLETVQLTAPWRIQFIRWTGELWKQRCTHHCLFEVIRASRHMVVTLKPNWWFPATCQSSRPSQPTSLRMKMKTYMSSTLMEVTAAPPKVFSPWASDDSSSRQSSSY